MVNEYIHTYLDTPTYQILEAKLTEGFHKQFALDQRDTMLIYIVY